MSFARLNTAIASSRTTLRRCSIQPRLVSRIPSALVSAFVTSAKAMDEQPQEEDTLLKSLDRIASPMAIATINLPLDVTRRGATVTNRQAFVHGATIQSVSVISKNPPLLSFSMRAESNPIYDAIQYHRDSRFRTPAPKIVINVLDDSQCKLATAFVAPRLQSYKVWEESAKPQLSRRRFDQLRQQRETSNDSPLQQRLLIPRQKQALESWRERRSDGRKQESAEWIESDEANARHPFELADFAFDVAELTTADSSDAIFVWRDACPPVLNTCHAAYVCTLLRSSRAPRYNGKRSPYRGSADDEEAIEYGDEAETEFEKGSSSSAELNEGPGELSKTAELMHYIMRIDSVRWTKPRTGRPLVLHDDIFLMFKE